MSARETFSKWWRIAVLVLLVSVAVYALFVPGGVFGTGDTANVDEANATEDDPIHNLVFGLDLDGGARISAPPVGMTVDGLSADRVESDSALRSAVYESLQSEHTSLETADVTVRHSSSDNTYSVEVFDDNVSQAAFAEALSNEGYDVSESDVRDGVTQQTRDEMVAVIENKLNEAGLAGGRVYDTETLGGQHYIVAEAPGYTSEELQSLLEERGSVEIRAYVPDPEGSGEQVNITMLEQGDFDNIDSAEFSSQNNQYQVPISILSDGTAAQFEERMNQIGFTTEGAQPGANQCQLPQDEDGDYDFSDTGEQWCLLTVSDGEIVSAHQLDPSLAASMESNQWHNDPQFVMVTGGPEGNQEAYQQAVELSINLRAGVLTAPLDFGEAQVFSVQPSLAEQFKSYSLFIGILAVLAVSGMVYVRYRDPRVALPMIVTALAEVVVLLGVAAAAGMALSLAHVAGFIAVVGTGVDDLVIIADEVMDEGDVSQRRVFDTRFRKAFWTIGAAAATTIIAMSPLAVMSLGDLQGFAIVTILGVLIGVFITRPAYGSILRKLMTSEA